MSNNLLSFTPGIPDEKEFEEVHLCQDQNQQPQEKLEKDHVTPDFSEPINECEQNQFTTPGFDLELNDFPKEEEYQDDIDFEKHKA